MRIPYEELKQEFQRILLQLSFAENKAGLCAEIFAKNSLDGVYSHGINRFPVFVEYVKSGLVNSQSEPELSEQNGIVEVWNGYSGPGVYNATLCMDRAITLAKSNGIGCVALFNNNHWMRGGTYGWQAAENGCMGICFTNAVASMAPWGGKAPRLGNNPLVIAVPRPNGHVVLDMALSQFSYGKMQEYELENKVLPVPGGYDENGHLTTNPAIIRKTKRALPIGFWKGSGLSLLLDIVLTALTGGRSTALITHDGKETNVSQCFICLYKEELHAQLIENILDYTKSEEAGQNIFYPGERTLLTRKENLQKGIPVNETIWNKIVKM